MTNEMIELVEKVIIEALKNNNLPIRIAIKAIEAMREPTQKQLSAGGFHCIMHAYAVTESDMRQAKNVYQAMIDAALKDG